MHCECILRQAYVIILFGKHLSDLDAAGGYAHCCSELCWPTVNGSKLSSTRDVSTVSVVAAGKLMVEPTNLELLVREDVALQQLVLASMGTNPLVVQQAVKIMSAVGAYAGAAKRLVKHNVVRAITGMLTSGDKVRVG